MHEITPAYAITITSFYKNDNGQGKKFLRISLINKALKEGFFSYKGEEFKSGVFELSGITYSITGSNAKPTLKLGIPADSGLQAFKTTYNSFVSGYIDVYALELRETVKDTAEQLQATERARMRFKIVGFENITSSSLTLKLDSLFNASTTIPTRTVGSKCTHDFKSRYCGYAGTETTCDKTYKTCKRLRNLDRFNGVLSDGKY